MGSLMTSFRSTRGALAGVVVAAAALAFVAGCKAPIPSTQAATKNKAEVVVGDMTLTGLDGKPVQLKSLTDGKVALVDVWATWCAPCLAAMPHLDKLHAQYREQGFTVVGIMIDKNARSIGPDFMKDHQVGYPILMDDDAQTVEKNIGEVQGIPTLLLVDKNGKILQRFEGYGGPDQLSAAVEAALKQS